MPDTIPPKSCISQEAWYPDCDYPPPSSRAGRAHGQMAVQLPANAADCSQCPLLSQCTRSAKHQKVIQRHLYEDQRDNVRAFLKTDEGQYLAQRRRETVERSFADSKQLHGLRYARYRRAEAGTTPVPDVCAGPKPQEAGTPREPASFVCLCSVAEGEIPSFPALKHLFNGDTYQKYPARPQSGQNGAFVYNLKVTPVLGRPFHRPDSFGSQFFSA
jgi:hypothetical protein